MSSVAPPADEPFFEELDTVRRHPGGRSCCTIWTLGLLLTGLLAIGLRLVFW